MHVGQQLHRRRATIARSMPINCTYAGSGEGYSDRISPNGTGHPGTSRLVQQRRGQPRVTMSSPVWPCQCPEHPPTTVWRWGTSAVTGCQFESNSDHTEFIKDSANATLPNPTVDQCMASRPSDVAVAPAGRAANEHVSAQHPVRWRRTRTTAGRSGNYCTRPHPTSRSPARGTSDLQP